MKKIYALVTGLLLTVSVVAQAPQKMSYQAVIRNSSNVLITSVPVGMRISVLQGTSTGTVAYAETQTISTNANGLVSLEIGSGTPVAGTFAGINWATGPYFIKIETDPTGGTTYSITGTSQLMSVPYALFSANGTPGAIGATGPQGPAGAAGQGGVTQAGLGISVTGTGTVADPYIVSTKTYTIGLWPELGGYVFRISADGKHGLVAETQDQGFLSNWYGTQNLMSNPNTHSTNGQKFMDWRVPTLFELTEMYNNRVLIGNFTSFFYWSSTEYDSPNAYSFYFTNGVASVDFKTNRFIMRGVRAF